MCIGEPRDIARQALDHWTAHTNRFKITEATMQDRHRWHLFPQLTALFWFREHPLFLSRPYLLWHCVAPLALFACVWGQPWEEGASQRDSRQGRWLSAWLLLCTAWLAGLEDACLLLVLLASA